MLSELRNLPAPAKINLFLHVTGQRANGYHELQTVFQFIDLCDTLDLVLLNDDRIELINPMPDVPPETDLVVRAARLLKSVTGCQLGVKIAVRKEIPVGGGLGGGSSDAATTLLGLNRLWNCGLSKVQLAQIGLQLGADVPVFIHGQNALATGIGEELAPIKLPSRHIVLARPATSVPTESIFKDSQLTRNTPHLKIAGSTLFESALPGQNDLEPVACRLYPKVGEALELLAVAVREAVAVRKSADQNGHAGKIVRMSGSGSCVFAWCLDRKDSDAVVRVLRSNRKFSNNKIQVWQVKTLGKHPLNLN